MVSKLIELPMFVVFNSGTKSFGEQFRFCFLLMAVHFI
jgi:hypothetical protein